VLVENAGFDKEVDFVSCGLETISFQLPAWLSGLAERVRQKVALEIHSCATMPEMVAAGYEVLQTYNRAFTQNWEYYPLPDAEIKWVIENLKPVAIPRLMKIIRHQGQTVGFLLALPDLSAPLQRAKGRLHPWSIIDLLLEKRRMHEIVLVIVAIVEQFQLQAGNALMMLEMEKTMRALGVRRAELINMAESATQMRRDMTTLGLKPYKTHRVYRKEL
jgi:hypothetical protein